MKVAIICEGRVAGEDAQVYAHFARRIQPSAVVHTFPQGKKPELIAEAGAVTNTLFAAGYTRVLIIWDIMPRWNRPDGEQQDTQDIQTSLTAAGVIDHPCLFLIAIHHELEAWLLADGAALSTVLSRPTHQVIIANDKNADTLKNPKKKLEKLFKEHNMPIGPPRIQGTYQPKLAAIRIAENIPESFRQLAKIDSFKKFGRSLTAPCGSPDE